MKHFIKLSFSLAIPLAVVFTLLSIKGVHAGNVVEIKQTSRPYLIEAVEQNGTSTQFTGVSDSIDPFLIARELGAAPYPEDKLSSFPDIRMGIGSKITLRRAPVFYVKDGKKNFEFRSWKARVGEMLAEKNVELGNDDKINFASDYPLENGMSLIIIRVAITNLDIKETVDFPITKKEDKTLDEGKTRIETAGVSGVRTKTYLVRREDGDEVSRKLIKNEITTPPVTQVLIVGTKPAITVRCNYNDTVLAASIKYNVKPNDICNLMMKESNGHSDSVGNHADVQYYGLFQYTDGFWQTASSGAGYSGASYFDPTAQIYATTWAWSHGYKGRW